MPVSLWLHSFFSDYREAKNPVCCYFDSSAALHSATDLCAFMSFCHLIFPLCWHRSLPLCCICNKADNTRLDEINVIRALSRYMVGL